MKREHGCRLLVQSLRHRDRERKLKGLMKFRINQLKADHLENLQNQKAKNSDRDENDESESKLEL